MQLCERLGDDGVECLDRVAGLQDRGSVRGIISLYPP